MRHDECHLELATHPFGHFANLQRIVDFELPQQILIEVNVPAVIPLTYKRSLFRTAHIVILFARVLGQVTDLPFPFPVVAFPYLVA
ncbi:hypothetical protein D3C84_852510 [compost metagenome]